MIKFENTEVMGWEAAIRGMRNPMNSWEKSDSGQEVVAIDQNGDEWFGEFKIGPNDYGLMMRLRNAGTDHRKFMRMITVYVDITAPLYFWKEFSTYKVGTVANSCSTMHKIHAKEFTLEDFSCEHLSDADIGTFIPTNDNHMTISPIELLERFTIPCLNHYRTEFIETKDKKYWWQMIQLLPSSYNQTRNVMLNYEVLANIYRQRKNHKLDEWREICKWIETLPYSELITVDSREAIKEELRKEIMKVREIPAPWEPYDTDEYAKTYPDQLITIAEMEADARRAIKEE